MNVIFFGTTSLLFDDGEDQILFDCHLTRPSLLKYAFGRLSTDKTLADRVIREFGIDRLRGIFISHTHHDHVLDAPYVAAKCGAELYGSTSALNAARGGGVPEERLHLYRVDALSGGAEMTLDARTRGRRSGTEAEAIGLKIRGGKTAQETVMKNAGESAEPEIIQEMQSGVFHIGEFCIRVLPSKHSKTHWYNDDLGETIDRPLVQPAWRWEFREGGSYDFAISHGGRRLVIRPSCNYIEGQWSGERADILFLGIGGLSKLPEYERSMFFAETLGTLQPSLVIPLHWDNFFCPLYGPVQGLPKLFEDSEQSLRLLVGECKRRGIQYRRLLPRAGVEL